LRQPAALEDLDAQLLEQDGPALGLQADVTLARLDLGGAGDLRAVDGQLDGAVDAGDAVVVPLAGGLGVLAAGQAALPAGRVGAVRLEAGAVDAEDVAL